jgi:hypothetical protein
MRGCETKQPLLSVDFVMIDISSPADAFPGQYLLQGRECICNAHEKS